MMIAVVFVMFAALIVAWLMASRPGAVQATAAKAAPVAALALSESPA